MKNKMNFKKALVIVSILAISLTAFPAINYVGAWAPCIACSPLSSKVVEENGQIIFTLNYTNDINTITLNENDLRLDGFTADVAIRNNGNARVVTLSNIKDTSGSSYAKRVYISGGTAVSSDGQLTDAVNTETFKIKGAQKATDTKAPVAVISGPSVASVYAGGTVKYTITYSDDVALKAITLNVNDLRLSGFTANKNVSVNGNVATITLSNIQGNVGGNKVMYVSGGTAVDTAGNLCNKVQGAAFTIVAKENTSNKEENKTENKKEEDKKPSDWVANPNTGK